MELRVRGKDPDDQAAALLARMRAGAISQDQLALAAHLGYPPARMLAPDSRAASMKDWLAFFGAFEERDRLAGRLALVLAEYVLQENPELRDFDQDLPQAVSALAAWLEGRLSAGEVTAAAEAARDTAAGLEWLSFNAGPANSLPSATAADIVVECALVAEDWTGIAWALQLAAIGLGQGFDDQGPPSEALLFALSKRLGPWALQTKLTRIVESPPS